MTELTCPFCFPDKNDIIFQNSLWYARWDAFPATPGHLLVIPFRHCPDIFSTTPEEQAALPEMLFSTRALLEERFAPAGYNIVINTGAAADQRVMHCHVHLIPRDNEESKNPPGGIRGFVMERPERVL